jgi:16S rRNA (guanine966-N2)-methyltransferase
MRIISGKFKGKKLSLPIDKKTRPLRDLVKESIFNLILHSNKFRVKIENSNVLDLFSGTGSFGIECISRGANLVYFFENYPDALKIIKKNLSDLNSNQKYKIIEENCFNISTSNDNLISKFDLIFIDPPYKELRINDLIEKIIHSGFLKPKGIFIIHRHKKDTIAITKELEIVEERTYGLSKILIGI